MVHSSTRSRDFQIVFLTTSVLVGVFGCAVLWEFAIEPALGGVVHDSAAEQWEYVLTSTAFAAIALIFPTMFMDRALRRRDQAETAYRDFAEMASDWLWETDAAHRFTRFSAEVNRITPNASDDTVGITRFDLRLPIDRDDEKWRAHRADLDAHRPFKDLEYPIKIADGSVRHIRVNGRPVYSRKGKFIGYRGTGSDITETVNASSQVHRREQEFRALLESAPDAMVIVGDGGTIEYVNNQTVALFGHTQDQLVGKHVEILIPDRYRGAHLKHRDSYFADPAPRPMGREIEIYGLAKDGREIPVEISLSSIQTSDRQMVCAAVRDITERKATQERIEFLAHHDALTELPNRALFDDRLKVAIAQAERNGTSVAVQMIDLDMFKEINDTLGHSVGDHVLVEVASRLRECVRAGDTVARFGGDEFAVILPDAARQDTVQHICDRMLKSIARPLLVGGESRTIGCSIGIAVYPDDAGDGENLVRLADAAMYRAKRAGRGRRQFHGAVSEPELAEENV